MKKNASFKRLFLIYIPLLFFVLFLVFPFYWMLITSLKTSSQLFSKNISYIASTPTFQNYTELVTSIDFFSYMGNSLLIAICTVALSLTVSLLAAYGFSRFIFKGKHVFLTSFLSINMFPTVLLLIPLYSIMRTIGLLYTPYSLVLAYSTFTIPFAVWLLTSYLNEIPTSLDEAAMIDGCSRFQAFYKVILPLTIPGVIATGSYIFITAWNEFVFASMLTNDSTRTLPVALQSFIGQFDIQWGLLSAGGVVTILPTLILFIFIQKRLIHGMTAGAVKG
jgi:multiple sugar transport system permease protein